MNHAGTGAQRISFRVRKALVVADMIEFTSAARKMCRGAKLVELLSR
jgi:hypothetical protein